MRTMKRNEKEYNTAVRGSKFIDGRPSAEEQGYVPVVRLDTVLSRQNQWSAERRAHIQKLRRWQNKRAVLRKSKYFRGLRKTLRDKDGELKRDDTMAKGKTGGAEIAQEKDPKKMMHRATIKSGPFAKAECRQKEQEAIRQAQREELQRRRTQREERERERLIRHRKMSRRTTHGQPVLKYRMDALLKQIEDARAYGRL